MRRIPNRPCWAPSISRVPSTYQLWLGYSLNQQCAIYLISHAELISSAVWVHRQNVEVTNAESTKRRTTKHRKTKHRMGQNVEWKKRRMGQNVEWKKRRMEKTPNGTKRRMGKNRPTGGKKCRMGKMLKNIRICPCPRPRPCPCRGRGHGQISPVKYSRIYYMYT